MTRHFEGIHLVEIPQKCTSKWHQASINHQIGCSFWGFYCPYKIFDKMFRNILSLVTNRSFSSLSGTLAENGNLSWTSSEKTAFTVPALRYAFKTSKFSVLKRARKVPTPCKHIIIYHHLTVPEGSREHQHWKMSSE